MADDRVPSPDFPTTSGSPSSSWRNAASGSSAGVQAAADEVSKNEPAAAFKLEHEALARLEKIGVKVVKTVDKSGFAEIPALFRRMTGDEKHEWAAASTLDVLWVLYDRVLKEVPANARVNG